MTLERDARKKWCPFTAGLIAKARIEKDGTRKTPLTLCLGAQCMAWRSFDPPDAHSKDGWCGLASKPEFRS